MLKPVQETHGQESKELPQQACRKPAFLPGERPQHSDVPQKHHKMVPRLLEQPENRLESGALPVVPLVNNRHELPGETHRPCAPAATNLLLLVAGELRRYKQKAQHEVKQ